MHLRGIRKSQNVEDRRRSGGARGAGTGGVGLLVILAIGYFADVDVTPLLDGMSQSQPAVEFIEKEQQAGAFSAAVRGATEKVWVQVFTGQLGRTYTPPVLVLFSGDLQHYDTFGAKRL